MASKWKRNSPPWPLSAGQQGVDGKMVSRTKRSVDEANSRSLVMEAGKRTCRSSDVRDS